MAEAMADRLKTIVACSGIIKRPGITGQDWYIFTIYRYELVCYTDTKKTT